MSLFSWLFGRSDQPKRQRAPNRSGEDRLKAEKARYLAHLRRTNPRKYEDLMAREIGLGESTPNDPFEQVKKLAGTVKELRESGLLPKEPAQEPGERLVEKLIENADKLAPVAVGAFQAAQLGATPRRIPAGEPFREQPAIAAPETTASLGEETMSLVERLKAEMLIDYIRTQLEHETPVQAAAWIRSQKHPAAQHLVNLIRQTDDANLFDRLEAELAGFPAYQPLLAWLHSRAAWTLEVAQHLRGASPNGRMDASPSSGPATI